MLRFCERVRTTPFSAQFVSEKSKYKISVDIPSERFVNSKLLEPGTEVDVFFTKETHDSNGNIIKGWKAEVLHPDEIIHPGAILLRAKRPRDDKGDLIKDDGVQHWTKEYNYKQKDQDIYIGLVESVKIVKTQLKALNRLSRDFLPPPTKKKPKKGDAEDDLGVVLVLILRKMKILRKSTFLVPNQASLQPVTFQLNLQTPAQKTLLSNSMRSISQMLTRW
jgi:hypothetical protein